MIKKILIINGTQRTLVVEGQESLAEVLRDRLLLTGCKIGCGEGHCGACNVIVDGKVTRSCITKISKVPMPRSRPSRESGRWRTFILCRQPGSLMAAPSAVSVRRALL